MILKLIFLIITGLYLVSCDSKIKVSRTDRFDEPVKPVVNEQPEINGMMGFKSSGKWGFMNEKREVVIQPKFDFVFTFKSGLCIVSEGNKWGVINKKGEYEYSPFDDDLDKILEIHKALLQLSKGTSELIRFADNNRLWGFKSRDLRVGI